jgi:hypothetical protein
MSALASTVQQGTQAATHRTHSTPDPETPPSQPPPPPAIPDDMPDPAHAPVEEPVRPEPPMRAA